MFGELLAKLDARQQRLVAGGVLLLSLAILFTYVLLPPLKIYRQGLVSQAVLQDAARQGEGINLQLDELATEVEALKRRLHGDMANLPDKQLEAFVIGRLQTISWRNHVELVSVEPTSGDTVQMFSESLFKIELAGDYFDLFEWIGEINEELGFVVIKEYQMRPTQDIASNPALVVNLTIASYRVAA